jgi:hypothetical protein
LKVIRTDTALTENVFGRGVVNYKFDLRILFHLRRSSLLHSDHSGFEHHLSDYGMTLEIKQQRYILLPDSGVSRSMNMGSKIINKMAIMVKSYV